MKDTKLNPQQQSASSISDAAGIQENVAPNRQESTSTQSQGTNQGNAVDSFFEDASKKCGMESFIENPTHIQSSIQDQQPQSIEDVQLPKKITVDKLLSLLKESNESKIIVVNGVQYDIEEPVAQTLQPQSFKIFGSADSNQVTPKPPSTPGSIPSGFNFALIKANILDSPGNKGGFCPSVLPKSFAPQEEFKQLTNSAPSLLFNNFVRQIWPQVNQANQSQSFVSKLQPPTQFPKHQLNTGPPLALGTPLPPIFEQPQQIVDMQQSSLVTTLVAPPPQITTPIQTTSTQTGSNNSNSTPTMKKHKSEMPTLNDSIVQLNSKFIITNFQKESLQFQQSESIIKENEELKKQTSHLQQEITQLKNIQRVLSTFVVQHFTPKNILAEIKDENILEILSHEQMSNAKLHLSFLFSSPLVKVDEQERVQPLQAIDHLKEFTGVLESLNQTGMQINYQKVPATIENINLTLNANPIALHFSGHGIRGQLPKQQTLYMQQREFKGYLVVEDQKAQAYYLPDNLLKNILHSQGTRLEFVFVASCHSQFAGNIFHQAGAKHVICVKENFQISDDASICFSKIFYTALFSQSKTVCEAFQIAKRHLQSHEDRELAKEHEKFMLLKQEEDDEELEFDPYKHNPTFFGIYPQQKKKHQCRIFGPFKEGKFTNVGNQPLFRVETSKLEDFIGRTLDLHSVITQLLVKRVVTIKGIPGIGKTTLVKAVAHYLDERHQMRDGIILLSLRNLDQASMFITRLENIICKKVGNTIWKDDLPLEKITSFLKDKEILLILDNAETTSKQDPKNFHEVIQAILDQCPQIKFLFTSRKPIGSFEGHQEQVLELKELNIKYAVDLLKQKAPRPITDEEIKELLNIKPDKVLHSNPLKKPQKVGGSLESHHMFEILKGHPHAISLAAPLLQDKKLKELYYLLNSEEINEWLENQGIKDGAVGSLKVSMDISIKQLSETETRFFWLIGLLPGGCTTQDLNVLWGDGWLTLAEKLLRASLLVKKSIADENVYQLFPFMNTYAQTNMNAQEKQVFHQKIVKYYADICKDLLKEQLEGRLNKLLAIETNIWACIYRMRDQISALEAAQYRARSPGLGFYPPTNTSGVPSSGSLSSGIIKPLAISCSSETDQPPQSAGESINDASSAAPLNTVVTSLAFGFDEQSNRDNQSSKNEYYDEYDSILSQRINGPAKQRSKSEKVAKNMRGGSHIPLTQPQNNEIYETNSEQEEENKNCSNGQIGQLQNEEEQSSFFEMLRNQELYLQQQQQQQFNTFQTQNHPSDQSFNISCLDTMGNLNRQSSMENSYENFITTQPSNQQNQMNNSFSGFPNEQNQSSLFNRRYQQSSFMSQNLNQSFRLDQQQQYMFGNRPVNFNEELSQIQQYQQIRDDNSSADSIQNHIQNITYQMPSFINNSLTSQSMNDNTSYLQSNSMSRRPQKRLQYAGEPEIIPELIREESVSYADDDMISQSLLQMRSIDKQEVLERTQEEQEREDLESSSDSDNEPKAKQMASSLKVQSSKVFDDEGRVIEAKKMSARPESSSDGITNNNYLNETLSAIDFPQVKEPEQHEERRTSLKKSQKGGATQYDGIAISKKVTIQENPEQKTSKEQSQLSGKKKKPKTSSATTIRANNLGGTIPGPPIKLEQALNQQIMVKQQHAQSSTVMTPDGSLLVYYITNLLLLTRYEDSLKVIEQFGLKLANDQMCQANLKKLQAYAMHAMQQAMHSNSYKEVKLKYEEALTLFQTLKSVLGQALCSWALGFLLYSHSQQFVTKQVNENKVFELAKRRLEDATQLYNQCKHFAGESQCHRILQFIKQKSKENVIFIEQQFFQFLDHIRQAKQLMTTENQLQQRGKSNFILINGSLEGIEESLLLEVIGDNQIILTRASNIMMKNKVPQTTSITSELKKKNAPQEETKKQEERPTMGLKSAARQNNKKIAALPQIKSRENNSESDSSMARKLPPKKKLSNQDLKESLDKIQEEEMHSSTPSPGDQIREQSKNNNKISQKRIEPPKDQRPSHTNSKPSIKRPSLPNGGVNFSQKNKEELQSNNSKTSIVKQKVKNDKVFSQEEIKHQEPQVFIENIESHNSEIFAKASEEMVFTDVDQIFEPSNEINGINPELQSRISMHLNKASQKYPQTSPQDKTLVIKSSNSRNNLKQSASQQNLERSKGIISSQRKSAQPPSTRPQSPKQVQNSSLSNSQSTTSIATPKIINKTNTSTIQEPPQTQVLSFNITTTTTVKIEGSIPSNTNLVIGPQLTMNGGQIQVPTENN